MNRKPIYPSLNAWRDGERLNQEAAAKKLGVTQGYYCRLEKGQSFPSRLLAKTISTETGVPLETILGVA